MKNGKFKSGSFLFFREALLLVIILFFSLSSFSQEVTINGRVTQQYTNNPLTGVSVTVIGKNIGTTSDENGLFTIRVSYNDTILFHSIGSFDKKVIAGHDKKLNVILIPKTNTLNQVVVIGYGTAKKKDLTGAVSSVDNTKYENLPNTNISQALRGRVPGVSTDITGRAGSGQSFHIRGQNSISASSNALIVVDGIIYDGNLADLNPNDIASIDVLRDASSAAIYGSRAANGVILVTTKKGISEKPTIQVDSYAGTQSFLMNEKLENADQYIQKILNYHKTLAFRGVEPVPDLSHPERYLNPAEAPNFEKGISKEPFDVISQPAPIQNYNLSVSANAGKTSYYLSGTWTDQKGRVIGDQFMRAAIRVNLETRINDWLKFGTNSSFAFIDNSGSPADLTAATMVSPYATYYLDSTKTLLNPYPITDPVTGNPLLPTLNSIVNQRKNLFGIFYGEVAIPFIDGLTYRFTYSNNLISSKNYEFVPSFHAAGVNREASSSDGYSESQDMYLQNLIKYNHTFAKNHNIDLTLLYNYNFANATGLSGNANTFPTDLLNFYSLSLGANQSANATYSDYHAIAMMARLNYKYKDRYLLTLTERKDGASLFSINHKYAYFPSAALAWIASDERFLENNKTINFLKLRLSYGTNGNEAISRYGSFSIVSPNSNFDYIYDGSNTVYGLAKTSLGNPNLKWETTFASNYGVDFELFKGKVSGSIDYYNSNTKDLLLNRNIPTLNGFGSILSNLGEVNNKGIEASFNSVLVKNKIIKWDVGFNLAHNKNKIVHLYGVKDANGREENDISNSWFIGKSLGAYYSYVPDGIWQVSDSSSMPTGFRPGDVRFKDLNGDGKISPDSDRTILGYNKPDLTYGLNTTLRVKGFSLYVLVAGSIGGVRDNSRLLNPAASLVYRDRGVNINWWTPENHSNTHPSIDYQNSYAVPFLQSITFIRLQDISLSYDFSQQLLDRLKVKNLKIYVSAKNPLLFTKWQGWDPESSESGAAQFPTMKIYTFGLDFTL